MQDPDERTASPALRNGGPATVRRAIGWYRTNDRLHCGDQITVAADALAGYRVDTAAGKDALLLCDTTEMCDALNQRLHHDTIAADAPTITGARGHEIGVGDLILTRDNDASIPLRNTDDPAAEQSPVRNGQRWQVTAINTDNNRLAVRRLDDNTLGVFFNDYVREHITHGYAVTVHSAQGVTADTTHAVLSETATRALAYVAMTRGRQANTAYLYQRACEASEYSHDQPAGVHLMRRGGSRAAATMMRAILARESLDQTAHDLAAGTDPEQLPERVARLLIDHRAQAVQSRRATYQSWQAKTREPQANRERDTDQHLSRDREQSMDYSVDL
jgi:hypothetical protein